jgi:DnaJ-class molecular chaperone
MGNDGGQDIPVPGQLESVECRDCFGVGSRIRDNGLPFLSGRQMVWEETCLTCWGVGEIEVQHGPKDKGNQVPHRPSAGEPGPVHPARE